MASAISDGQSSRVGRNESGSQRFHGCDLLRCRASEPSPRVPVHSKATARRKSSRKLNSTLRMKALAGNSARGRDVLPTYLRLALLLAGPAFTSELNGMGFCCRIVRSNSAQLQLDALRSAKRPTTGGVPHGAGECIKNIKFAGQTGSSFLLMISPRTSPFPAKSELP
jgi:hypothetical protein